MSSNIRSYLNITSPVFLEGDWLYWWFDVARQQMLLYKERAFYVWSPLGSKTEPTLFFADRNLPDDVILAKISLDSKYLALQCEDISIFVIDLEARRNWTIEIKNYEENRILPLGVLWSEHGGNSQDLVIITQRGLELYKISSKKGCKLSRTVSLRVAHFWFEPNFRAVVCASLTRSNGESCFEMHGFLLRYDLTDTPRLELPPPDKTPVFVLPLGVRTDDIKLVVLYDNLFCSVRYTENGSDFLGLYLLSKSRVEKIYSLPLYVSSPIKLSVVDNLLCAHCLDARMTFLFDISLPPSNDEGGNKDEAYCCGACTLVVYDVNKPLAASVSDVDDGGDWHDIVGVAVQDMHVAQDTDDGYTSTEKNRHAEESYSGAWQFLSPYWIWDPSRRCMWSVKCNLQSVAISTADPIRLSSFLCQRGRPLNLPRLVFYYDTNDCVMAKATLLRKILFMIDDTISLGWFERVFETIVFFYAKELNFRKLLAAAENLKLDSDERRRSMRAKARTDDAPLEPSYALQVFFPEISSISHQSSQRIEPATPPPLTVHRDKDGNLIVTQTEMLCRVWLPAIRSVKANIERIIWCITAYISALRMFDIAVETAISMTLVNLLVLENRYADITKYVQQHFFTDSTELAMLLLEISDALDTSQSSNNSSRTLEQQMIRVMQQCGLDMLWRMDDKTTVVRWLLSHRRLIDAIGLCVKRRGQWKIGLTPATILGTDFFNCALSCIQDVSVCANEVQRVGLLHTVHRFLTDWDPTLLSITKVFIVFWSVCDVSCR